MVEWAQILNEESFIIFVQMIDIDWIDIDWVFDTREMLERYERTEIETEIETET
ncbi:hypothetical protein [Ignatzschineria cameli]|uniref:hypothetical protein n=1 Tax=Ignatzschineria cameli TaxID=2182793 RepID=UPI001300579B|nr:hypothetical protein [Ignatzschineria cameli]